MADVDDVGPGFSPAIDVSPHGGSFCPAAPKRARRVVEGGSLSFSPARQSLEPDRRCPEKKVLPGCDSLVGGGGLNLGCGLVPEVFPKIRQSEVPIPVARRFGKYGGDKAEPILAGVVHIDPEALLDVGQRWLCATLVSGRLEPHRAGQHAVLVAPP